ncbi:hypothetical protein GCM10009789_12060 [Kribbella sancticallisti]|uniref:Uncharacterized protein n=2 Tax=Kribbella sancticallisti TaxID=460087 RepID=A0ABN2CN52_9ACTN
MNKKHWITVESGGTVDEKLLKQLVTDSYHLVVGARGPVWTPRQEDT